MKSVQASKLEEVLGIVEIGAALAGFYTVESAAAELDVTRVTIYRLLEAGNLEGGKVVDGRGDLIKVLVSKRSVEAYANWRKAKPQLGQVRTA